METINLGDFVCCDFCNSDGKDSHGGVMVGNSAICGFCCEKHGYDKPDYKYKSEVSEIFPKDKTFKENVLTYRFRTTGTTEGEIIIKPF